MSRLPRPVLLLGLVSFFTDVSSEMIYPLLPVFLSSVLGAGALALGIIEGIAESTASLLKIVSGIWTDRLARRKPFLLAGYGLASVARPLIGLATVWPVVLVLRFTDRVGKGLRTSPRDAMLADVVTPEQRGEAFGFHRSMDHAGAAVGPLLAAGLLWLGMTLQSVFLLAAVPAAVVMLILFFAVKEPAREPQREAPKKKLDWKQWGELGGEFRAFLLAMFIFTLGNSTDAFILLRFSDAGVPAEWIAVLWSAHHLVKVGATYLGGRLSDRVGRRGPILSGWVLYAATYASFAFFASAPAMVVTFLVYGIFYGLTEPSEKAWVADLVPERLRGTAFGFYHGVIGLGALPASLIFGALWKFYGAPVAFLAGSGLAFAAAILLLFVPARRPAAG